MAVLSCLREGTGWQLRPLRQLTLCAIRATTLVQSHVYFSYSRFGRHTRD